MATENALSNGSSNGTFSGKHIPSVDPSIILHPNDVAAVPQLLESIATHGAALATSNSDETRLALLESARALVVALEKPRETMIRHCWGEHGLFAVLKFGIDVGVWARLGADDRPKSVAELAIATGVDEDFLARSLKHAAAMGCITETGHDEYRATNLVRALTLPIMAGGYGCFAGPGSTGGLTRAVYSLPAWLADNGHKSPPNKEGTGPLQYAFDTKQNMFDWLHANPPGGANFNYHMGGYSNGRPSWFDKGFYPVQDRLLGGFDDGDGSALLVDIGGGLGHDIESFRASFPGVPGRLVLQDLQRVIGQIPAKDDGIERTVYDFHTEQPVKGARAYYMHSVLHDWSDDVCVSILNKVRAAMKAGYSRLLINENVIPDTGASWEMTGLDLMLASLLSSRERTRVEWMRLLEEKAGLVVTKIYHFAGNARSGVESLIECELRV